MMLLLNVMKLEEEINNEKISKYFSSGNIACRL